MKSVKHLINLIYIFILSDKISSKYSKISMSKLINNLKFLVNQNKFRPYLNISTMLSIFPIFNYSNSDFFKDKINKRLNLNKFELKF